MLTFAAPTFLAAGALLALVPLALHMLARTPPDRRPLPTARFLTPDRRTRLRLRRPTDLALLALRMAFLVLLGAAFSRPEWVPEPAGVSALVLLDAGADMAPVWEEAVAVARDRIRDDGILVVFDTTAVTASDPGATLDSLSAAGPGPTPSAYLAALRGLRATAGELHAESASAALITRPRWGAWSPGGAAAREAAWPARIDLVALAPPVPDPDVDGTTAGAGPGDTADGADRGAADRGAAALVGPEAHPLRPYATAALRALGYTTESADPPELVVVLRGTDDDPEARVPRAPRVMILGGAADGRDGAADGVGPDLWRAPGGRPDDAPRSRGRLVLPGGQGLDGWLPRHGEPGDGALVSAVWEDGRPAAAAARRDEACVAYLAADPASPASAAHPAFPRLLRTLAEACESPAAATGGPAGPGDESLRTVPLDRGARTVLRGDALPAMADLTVLDGPRGRPLARVLALLALLVALTETALAYGRRRVR